MSKRIKPEMGHNAIAYLRGVEKDARDDLFDIRRRVEENMFGDGYRAFPHSGRFRLDCKNSDLRHIEAKAGHAANLVNSDVCMNGDQLKWVRSKLFMSYNGYDPREWAPVINTFRLDCENCLRENCGMRNPDAPLEEVVGLAKESLKEEVKELSIQDILFDGRIRNLLARNGIKTCADLLEKNESDLLAIDRFGKRLLKKVKKMLAEHDLKLKDNEPSS